MSARLRILPILLAAFMFYFTMPMQQNIEPLADVPAALPVPMPPATVPLPSQAAQFALPSTGTSWGGGPKTMGADGNPISCKDLPEAQGGIFLGQLVPCITYTISMAASTFSAKLIAWMQPMFLAFLTLVVTLFGVRILQGEQHIHVPAIMLALKISLVIGIMNMIPNYIVPQTYAIMEEGVGYASGALGPQDGSAAVPDGTTTAPDGTVTTTSTASDGTITTTTTAPDGTTTTSTTTNGIHCPVNTYGGTNTPMIWKQTDCILGKLYGFSVGKDLTTGQPTANMLLASSVFGLLTGFLFGGSFGVAVFFAFVGVLVSIAMLVLRIVVTFLNGYLTVCVMLMIAPLFMPLVFLKVTSDYFEKWWKAILGGMLLPVIVASYSVVALLAYDAVLFAPNSLMQNLFSNSAIQKAIQQPKKLCNMTMTGNTQFELNRFQEQQMGEGAKAVDPNTDPKANNALIAAMMKNPFTQVVLNPLLAASNDGCGMFKAPQFDVTQIMTDPSLAKLVSNAKDPTMKDKKNVMMLFFKQAVEIFLMCFLINAGMKEVEVTFASFAAGSSIGATLMRAGAITSNLQQAYGKLQSNLTQEFQGKAIRDKDGNLQYDDIGRVKREKEATGSDFVTQLPGSVSRATATTLGGFVGGGLKKPPNSNY